jgi:hypothetical protein
MLKQQKKTIYPLAKECCLQMHSQKFAKGSTQQQKKILAVASRGGATGGMGDGTSLLPWKIWSQLSPTLGENIFQIFSNFGRKHLSNCLRSWEKI